MSEPVKNDGQSPVGEVVAPKTQEELKTAYEAAQKAHKDAYWAYNNALNKDKDYAAATQSYMEADNAFNKALAESGQPRFAFAETTLGRELQTTKDLLSQFRNEQEEAFRETPAGKPLFDKKTELFEASTKAKDALVQSGAKPAF